MAIGSESVSNLSFRFSYTKVDFMFVGTTGFAGKANRCGCLLRERLKELEHTFACLDLLPDLYCRTYHRREGFLLFGILSHDLAHSMKKRRQTTTTASSVCVATSAIIVTMMQSCISHGLQKLR